MKIILKNCGDSTLTGVILDFYVISCQRPGLSYSILPGESSMEDICEEIFFGRILRHTVHTSPGWEHDYSIYRSRLEKNRTIIQYR
jgi:hypothetical protein